MGSEGQYFHPEENEMLLLTKNLSQSRTLAGCSPVLMGNPQKNKPWEASEKTQVALLTLRFSQTFGLEKQHGSSIAQFNPQTFLFIRSGLKINVRVWTTRTSIMKWNNRSTPRGLSPLLSVLHSVLGALILQAKQKGGGTGLKRGPGK